MNLVKIIFIDIIFLYDVRGPYFVISDTENCTKKPNMSVISLFSMRKDNRILQNGYEWENVDSSI